MNTDIYLMMMMVLGGTIHKTYEGASLGNIQQKKLPRMDS